MVKKLLTLCELCYLRIAHLAKNIHWNPEFALNPFISLPPPIIDNLIISIIQLSTFNEPLLSSDLRLLLTTGRVRKLILKDLDDFRVTFKNLQNILIDLSLSCHFLKVIKLYVEVDEKDSSLISDALNTLLSRAQNIESIETSIEFDLTVLHNSSHLCNLVLDFPLKKSILDLIRINGKLETNNSLKCLRVYEKQFFKSSDIAVLLYFCPELTDLNCDITESFVLLSKRQLLKESYKYKIKKCCFGSEETGISRKGTLVTALFCPELQDIEMWICKIDDIYTIYNFQNLTRLSINVPYWTSHLAKDYISSRFETVLEKSSVGLNLKTLEIFNFAYINFPLIGIYCPLLQTLKVDYYIEQTSIDYSPDMFCHLSSLHLLKAANNFNDFNGSCEGHMLTSIISNATNLKDLKIMLATEVTDEMFENIMLKNNLLNLKILDLDNSDFSINGILNLVYKLSALESLTASITGTENEIDELRDIIHEINPSLITHLSTC